MWSTEKGYQEIVIFLKEKLGKISLSLLLYLIFKLKAFEAIIVFIVSEVITAALSLCQAAGTSLIPARMQADLKTKLIYVAPQKVSTAVQPQPSALHFMPHSHVHVPISIPLPFDSTLRYQLYQLLAI